MIETLLAFVGVLLLDRGTKALVFRKPGPGERRALVGPLAIRPLRNAAPRSWPKGSRAAWLASFGAGLAGSLVLIQIDPWAGTATHVGLGAALGGAASNLYDRLRFGAVLDFLDVGFGGVFNPADAALVLGLATVVGSHLLAVPALVS